MSFRISCIRPLSHRSSGQLGSETFIQCVGVSYNGSPVRFPSVSVYLGAYQLVVTVSGTDVVNKDLSPSSFPFSSSGLAFDCIVESGSVSQILISSDSLNIGSLYGYRVMLNPPSFFAGVNPSSSSFSSPDMSQYLKSSDVEILKTRLLALKTEFTRLENKWSRLDAFVSDLMHFNSILEGYKNTIPLESYVKLSSVVEKLKAALK